MNIKVLKLMCIRDDRKLTVSYYKPGRLEFDFDGVIDAIDDFENLEITPLVLPFIVRSAEEVEQISIDFKNFDVIFNAICEPDICKNALYSAAYFLKDNKEVPVINHPSLVLRMTRDNLYSMIKDVPGLYVPKVIRIRPDSLNYISEVAHKEEFYPFIFREVGKHTQSRAVLVESPKDIKKIEIYPFRGEEYYMVEYVDYRSPDGLFRKHRVYVIDGKLYPKSKVISNYWNVHGKDRKRIMDKDRKYRLEEESWLKNFQENDYAPIKEIYKATALDLFIVDFGILRDGRIVIFEASACFSYIIRTGADNTPEYAYREPYTRAVKQAVENMILRRANKSRIEKNHTTK